MKLVPPRIWSVPEYASSAGAEAIELSRMAGLDLDPWQEFVLEHSLGERKDGRWAAFEVGVTAPRQNGKDAILEARELAGLFLLKEWLLIHSAHLFATSKEHFLRLLSLIENTEELSRRVRKVARSHGEEEIQLRNGQRIKFFTRTKGSARGFSCDCLLLNEAMFLPEAMHGAMLPTLSARPNPQVWYTGSAVDQLIHENGLVMARLRERGIKGDGQIAYFEWSAEAANPVQLEEQFAADEQVWAAANPGFGVRISGEHIESERRAMDPRTFAVERLGVGDWPRTDGQTGQTVLPIEAWDDLQDDDSELVDPVCLSFDVSPDRSRASIAAAGRNLEGLFHLEIVECRRGTGWLVERLVELVAKHEPSEVVCDGYGPAASLLAELEEAEVTVTTMSASEHGQACGHLVDKVEERKLRHLGSRELHDAIVGAKQRPLGDAWAWSRKSSAVDITPLVAATLCLWSAAGQTVSLEDPVIF